MNLDTLENDLLITYEAEFVPFSKSRNAKPDPKASDLSLNWKVRLYRMGAFRDKPVIETDYMQGIGHIPGYKLKMTGYTIDEWEALKYTCEHGATAFVGSFTVWGKRPLPKPKFADVMYSLLSDASAIDCPTYEEWAGDVGYDKDSREGERMYKQCLEIGLRLRQLVGDKALAELRELFQDY
jgi:hypothetical protein